MPQAFFIAALVCGLLLNMEAFGARDTSRVKMVTTTVAGQAFDLDGQPLRLLGGVMQLLIFQFIGTTLPADYRAKIICAPNSRGEWTATTQFPIDPVSIQNFEKKTRGKTDVTITIGFRVLDGDNQPLPLTNGLLLTLNQIGKDPWPVGSSLTIRGSPDDMGYLWATAHFPVNEVTVNNFTRLANGQGK